MSAILNNKIQTTIFSIAKTAELAIQYGDDAAQEKNIYEKLIFEVATISKRAKKIDDCLTSLKNLENVNEFDKKYEEKMSNSKVNVRSSDDYKTWMNKILSIIDKRSVALNDNHVEDEDFEMTAEINDIDPITKKRMEDPLKNKICGHHYEKGPILETIASHPHFKCPVVGCTNREFIKKKVLAEDLEFKLILRRTKKTNSS